MAETDAPLFQRLAAPTELLCGAQWEGPWRAPQARHSYMHHRSRHCPRVARGTAASQCTRVMSIRAEGAAVEKSLRLQVGSWNVNIELLESGAIEIGTISCARCRGVLG